jgi:hypothetical protein
VHRKIQEIESLWSVVHRDVQRIEWRKLSSVVHRNVQEIEWRKLRYYNAQKCSGNLISENGKSDIFTVSVY